MMCPIRLIRATIVAVPVLLLLQQATTAQGLPEPTEHHKLLKNDVGTWDVECKLWMSPDADPMPFKGVETNRLLTGGLWVISDFKSEMGSEKFEGHGVLGYDPFKKKYVGGWVDCMSPSPSLMEGTYDADSKTMTMYSEGRDPETGKVVKSKSVGLYTGDDTRVFKMYMINDDGTEWKMMEMNYTRRKK